MRVRSKMLEYHWVVTQPAESGGGSARSLEASGLVFPPPSPRTTKRSRGSVLARLPGRQDAFDRGRSGLEIIVSAAATPEPANSFVKSFCEFTSVVTSTLSATARVSTVGQETSEPGYIGERWLEWFWSGGSGRRGRCVDVNRGQLSSIAEITGWAISSTPLSGTGGKSAGCQGRKLEDDEQFVNHQRQLDTAGSIVCLAAHFRGVLQIISSTSNRSWHRYRFYEKMGSSRN
ncbi:hypothetical protein K0M31_003573 [Melipona bicolor]|uniref:Uncharacterized protein n=1 Tax=Melipona bicolor TaxID=60889 RepID=A0AA40FZA2_9HYME|nr:hypothetical protein K0M31_003573 [Melipona bicolor]